MQLELSDEEAQVVDDVLGMWIDGYEGEAPVLAQSNEEAHWSTHQMRKTREQVMKVRMRLQIERRDQH